MRTAWLTGVIVGLLLPGAAEACPSTWRAKQWAATQPQVSFAVHCQAKQTGYRSARPSPSASTGKALLLVSFLRRNRNIAQNRSDLKAMIHSSDNQAATRIYNQLGDRPLRQTLNRAGMYKTRLCGCWASIKWSPSQYMRLFEALPEILPRKHRAWAMSQLRHITPSQQWGIPAASKKYKTYFKGGWRPEPGGWIVLQGALLKQGEQKISLAVFTRRQPSLEAGARKIKTLTRLLLKKAKQQPPKESPWPVSIKESWLPQNG